MISIILIDMPNERVNTTVPSGAPAATPNYTGTDVMAMPPTDERPAREPAGR